jgi:glycosyltransferase involved in cell wall biosynthesis
MKISIITAVRDAAKQIGATLLSVERQVGVDLEHVVVDGASTDGTLDVIRQHETSVARLVSEPDRGIYDAFNKGLALASGDVIAFLNAGDTYIGDDVVAGIERQFAQHQVDAVFGDVLIVDPVDRTRVVRHYRSTNFRPEDLAYGYMPAHPALFLKRSAYDRVGGYDGSYTQVGDFEFCVRAFYNHRISYLHVPKAMVCMPAGGVTNRGLRSKLINSREMLRACRTNGVATSYFRLSMRLPKKALENMLLSRRGSRS